MLLPRRSALTGGHATRSLQWRVWPFGKKERLPDAIRFGDDGFSLLRKRRLQMHVLWADVTGIAAFKRDVFIGTQVCLAFRIADRPGYVLATQDMDGWCVLLEAISRRFPGCAPEWLQEVSAPPFESPWTVVWGNAREPSE